MKILEFLLRRFSLETYVLILIPLLEIGRFVFVEPNYFLSVKTGALKSALFYFIFGGSYLTLGFIIVWLYFFTKLLVALQAEISKKLAGSPFVPAEPLAPIARGIIYLFLIIGLAMFAMALEVGNVFQSPEGAVVVSSNALMRLDHAIFGAYPTFLPLGDPTSLAREFVSLFFITVYRTLGLFLSISFLALLASKKDLLRKYLLVFFLTSFVSFPIWYRLPAVSPHFMYTHNVFSAEIPPEIAEVTDGYAYDPALGAYIKHVKEYKEGKLDEAGNEGRNFYPLTTFPSMHGAWGVMIAYFMVQLWKPLGLIAIPWAILNAAAGVYTQWHYAVDMILGAVITLIVIALVNFLMRIETRVYPRPERHLAIVGYIHRDAIRFGAFVKTFFYELRRFPWKAR